MLLALAQRINREMQTPHAGEAGMPLHTSGNVGTVNLNDKNVMFGFNMGGKHELLLNTLIFISKWSIYLEGKKQS